MNADSVKAKLKNLTINGGGTMQEKLTTYALERSIYRISVSKYSERFTLKGGIFLYALFDKEYARVTMDIDLLAQKISNDIENIGNIFKEIFSIEYDDALRFDLKSLTVKSITEFKEYHGVKVAINTYLDRTRIPVSIDIGFDDVVFPGRVKMDFPVLLNMEEPSMYAYSIYSVIAEKFEAFTSLGIVNGRYKDFYDIYEIAKNFDLDGEELSGAVKKTFSRRGTGFEEIVAFESDFTDDETRRNRWNAFIKKKKATEKVEFEEVIEITKRLLFPIAESVKCSSDFKRKWKHIDREWK